jgi:Xaa-Pro aminopeptidase
MCVLFVKMEKESADILVAAMLDEVAWLLNVRGDDVPNCPLAVSYAVVERGVKGPRPIMFVDDAKLGPEARKHLEDCRVEVCRRATGAPNLTPIKL